MAVKKAAALNRTGKTKKEGVLANVTRQREQTPKEPWGNPNDWLFLNPEGPLDNFVFGVLRRNFKNQLNTASAFAQAKLKPVVPEGDPVPPWATTAYRQEVLLSAGADDGFRAAERLFEHFDSTALEWQKSLVIYLTLSFPEPRRMHEDFEQARAFVKGELVERRGLPTLLVQHAPFLVGSTNPPHVHVLALARRLTSLGFADYVEDISKDAGQRLMYEAWQQFLNA